MLIIFGCSLFGGLLVVFFAAAFLAMCLVAFLGALAFLAALLRVFSFLAVVFGLFMAAGFLAFLGFLGTFLTLGFSALTALKRPDALTPLTWVIFLSATNFLTAFLMNREILTMST